MVEPLRTAGGQWARFAAKPPAGGNLRPSASEADTQTLRPDAPLSSNVSQRFPKALLYPAEREQETETTRTRPSRIGCAKTLCFAVGKGHGAVQVFFQWRHRCRRAPGSRETRSEAAPEAWDKSAAAVTRRCVFKMGPMDRARAARDPDTAADRARTARRGPQPCPAFLGARSRGLDAFAVAPLVSVVAPAPTRFAFLL
jgi:hypothetical protein